MPESSSAEAATRLSDETADGGIEQSEKDAFTASELEQLISAAVDKRVSDAINRANGALWQSIDQRIGRLEGMRGAIEEVVGSARKSEALITRLFAGTATEEDVKSFEAAQKLADSERKQAELLSRAEAAEKAISAVAGRQEAVIWDSTLLQVERYARGQGLSLEEAWPLLPKERKPDPGSGDTFGFVQWIEASKETIDKEVSRRQKEATEKPRLPSERAGSADQEMSGLEKIKRGLTNRKA